MPSAQAERLCPQAIWTPGHFDRYREVSALVMQVLVDETPFVDRVSIDEAFFGHHAGPLLLGKPYRHSPKNIKTRIELGRDVLDRLGLQ